MELYAHVLKKYEELRSTVVLTALSLRLFHLYNRTYKAWIRSIRAETLETLSLEAFIEEHIEQDQQHPVEGILHRDRPDPTPH